MTGTAVPLFISVVLYVVVQVRLCMLDCLQYGVPQTRHVSGWVFRGTRFQTTHQP